MSGTRLQYSSKYSTKFRLYIIYALHCITSIKLLLSTFDIHAETDVRSWFWFWYMECKEPARSGSLTTVEGELARYK